MSTEGVTIRSEKNARGIPHAPFVDDVDKYMGGAEADVEPVLRRFQEALAKYRYMENNLTQRRVGLEDKIPDITKTLKMVEFLQERRDGKKPASGDDELEDELDDEDAEEPKKPMRVTFELNDTLYAEAELEETDTVYLWLGANVMLAYKLGAAIDLLRTKLGHAQKTLEGIVSDLEYIKEQVTIMEVNTARVYNWDIKRRRERREKEEAEGKKG